jgi:hypothetical protein
MSPALWFLIGLALVVGGLVFVIGRHQKKNPPPGGGNRSRFGDGNCAGDGSGD